MMAPAIHIFRKDIRYLRAELAVFGVAVALYGLAASAVTVALLTLTMIYLVSRAFHAEPIPGLNQFWITRPYEWRSLLASKLLFILICVDLPIGLARLFALWREGFPVFSSIPALVWAQILLFGAVLLVAALASVSAGTMQFVIVMLGLAVAFLVFYFVLPFAVGHWVLINLWPESVEWFREALAFLLLVTAAAAVLLWQYRERKTGFSCFAGATGIAAVLAILVLLPPRAALAFVAWSSKKPAPPVQVSVLPFGLRWLNSRDRRDARVPVDLKLLGLPADSEIAIDGLTIGMEWPDGARWSGSAGITSIEQANGDRVIHASVEPTSPQPVELARIGGAIWLTTFGDPQTRTLPFTHAPLNAQDGLQCFAGFSGALRRTLNTFDSDRIENFNHYTCRAFFGWPSRLVFARVEGTNLEFTRLVSYSPFPAGLDLESNEFRYTSLLFGEAGPRPGQQVTIVTERPLAHFRKDF